MIKNTAASVMLGCLGILVFGACSTEPARTSDFDTGAPPAERIEITRQALSACVNVQRGAYGTSEDTYITALTPGSTNGGSVNLYSGQDGAAEKRTLLKFDLGFIPAGSIIDGATLTLFQTWKTGSSSTVNVHRSTAPWSQATATWNNSAGNHAPAVAATINAAAGFGKRTADVTALVQSWSDGTPNHGVVLEEPLVQRTVFRSNETATQADKPMLSVCYTTQTCDDGIQNQGETDVDCGGPCGVCGAVLITPPGHAYGAHGACEGWNSCGDAATCALWACHINGYSQLVSYGASGPCTGFRTCNLFYSETSIQWGWGNWCDVNGVSEIVCVE